MSFLASFFGRSGGSGGNRGGGDGGGDPGPKRPPRDEASASRERVFECARHVVHEKYRRTIKDVPGNAALGVTLPDTILVTFYWYATEAMKAAGVDEIEALTGRERAMTGWMAMAFDLDDAAFEERIRPLAPEKAETPLSLRAKWLKAAELEPRMEDIRRDGRRRAAEEGRARQKAVAALHEGPDLAGAYAIGCDQLRSGEALGAEGAPLFFLLPYGVQRVRAAGTATRPVWTDPPGFATLSPKERKVLDHLHKALANLGNLDVQFDLMTRRPQIETETGLLPDLAAAFSGHPMPAGKLPFGTDRRSPHWPADAKLPSSWLSLFDTVTAMHLNWDGPSPSLDLKDGH
jgi:hypothetical protein